jgi:hypothetical protein
MIVIVIVIVITEIVLQDKTMTVFVTHPPF